MQAYVRTARFYNEAFGEHYSATHPDGTAANWLELDEGYRPAPCHAGLYVLPSLLATAEAEDWSCGEMLRALVLGLFAFFS